MMLMIDDVNDDDDVDCDNDDFNICGINVRMLQYITPVSIVLLFYPIVISDSALQMMMTVIMMTVMTIIKVTMN